jgi:uncharacterized protein DUF1799
VKALYWQRPTAADPTTGVKPEDWPEPEVDLWPENWAPIQLFTTISTQWRTGAAGAIGLDYNIVFHELDRKGLSGQDYEEMMHAIRDIEEAALQVLHEK